MVWTIILRTPLARCVWHGKTVVGLIFVKVNIRAGGRVDSVQVIYAGYKGGVHGGQGGALHRLRLYEGDRIVRVTGRAGLGPGASLDQVTLYTKK